MSALQAQPRAPGKKRHWSTALLIPTLIMQWSTSGNSARTPRFLTNSYCIHYADINKTDFKGSVLFDKAMFNKCSFTESFFFEPALFINTFFANEASFKNSVFTKAAYFSPRDGRGIFANRLIMHSVDIQDRIRIEGANLKGASFLDTDLREIEFINCKWPPYTYWLWEKFPRIKAWVERCIPLTEPKIYDEGKAEPEKVEALYRQMKQRCKTDHNESAASDWHYNEKEMIRKRPGQSAPMLFLYWLSSGYAEKPFRAFIVLLGLIALFALPLQFAQMNISNINVVDYLSAYPDAFLSIIQYATLDKNPEISLSKDDCVHVGWRYYKLLVQLAIYLQAAFFALAVRNRYRR